MFEHQSYLADNMLGLSIRGEIPPLLVAIVGTRQPTSEAADAAFSIAKRLALSGIGVVSGLALGIDGAAHRGCLAGGGSTVAVLGHGLDAPVYPEQHSALAEAIAKRGALVSPFADAMPLSRHSLLARNHWIARLASAVWVVQTKVPGGALAAASHARHLGIPVLTSPWDDPEYQLGCNTLAQRGAEVVELAKVHARLEMLCSHVSQRPLEQGVLAL